MARIAPDISDIIVWKLDETSSTYRSVGTHSPNSSITDLTVVNTIDRLGNGPFGDPSANFPGAIDFPIGSSATRNYAFGANTINPQPPFSISFWVLLRSYQTNSVKHFISKQFRDHTSTNNYAAPFTSIDIGTTTSNSGQDWYFSYTGIPFVQTTVTFADFPVPLHKWCHVGFTHDGTNTKAYLNGCQMMTYTSTTQNLQFATPGPAISYNNVSYAITSTTGTYDPGVTDIGNHGDEVITSVTLPFPVTIYGNTFTTVNVSSNGFVEFGQASQAFGFTLPNASLGITICVFERDETTTSPQGIFTSTTGSVGSRAFNIEWRNKSFADGLLLNYEIRFFENSSIFETQYAASTSSNSGCIGIQTSAGGFSTVFSNSVAIPTAGTKLVFTPTVSSPGAWTIGASPPYLSVSSSNKEEANYMIQDIRIAEVVRPLTYFQNLYKVGALAINLANVTKYYKMRAYDLSCSTPTPVTWVDTEVSFANAPVEPCGGTYSDIEIIDSWIA